MLLQVVFTSMFSILLWISERTFEMTEEYCHDAGDINTVPYNRARIQAAAREP